MTDKLKKTVGFSLIGAIVLFAILGYANSDNVFYNNLLKSKKLNTPLEVFNWAIKNYSVPRRQVVNSNASPRYLIEKQQWLWCDEGATVMATLDHILGYKTRLIDLYGYDNISHHTVLQVLEKNTWVIYDFTNRIYNKPPKASTEIIGRHSSYLKKALIKPYPKLYNAVINNNCFLKYVALKLRGIRE